MADLEFLAQAAYRAYGDSTGWKNYQGLDMPRWEDLGEHIQRAWRAAVFDVLERTGASPEQAD